MVKFDYPAMLGWRLKFNGGNPVWVSCQGVIMRKATFEEIYEHMDETGRAYYYNNMTDEQKKRIDDLFNKSTN